ENDGRSIPKPIQRRPRSGRRKPQRRPALLWPRLANNSTSGGNRRIGLPDDRGRSASQEGPNPRTKQAGGRGKRRCTRRRSGTERDTASDRTRRKSKGEATA